jgi:hypothetical protein
MGSVRVCFPMMARHTQFARAILPQSVTWIIIVLAEYRRRAGNDMPFLKVLVDVGEAIGHVSLVYNVWASSKLTWSPTRHQKAELLSLPRNTSDCTDR